MKLIELTMLFGKIKKTEQEGRPFSFYFGTLGTPLTKILAINNKKSLYNMYSDFLVR